MTKLSNFLVVMAICLCLNASYGAKTYLEISEVGSAVDMESIQHGEFDLINADTDAVIDTFTGDFIWNLNTADKLNIVARPFGTYTHVKFISSDGYSKQEGVAPYAYYGDIGGDYGDVPGYPSLYLGFTPSIGTLSFTVEYINSGTVINTDTFSITFVNEPLPVPGYFSTSNITDTTVDLSFSSYNVTGNGSFPDLEITMNGTVVETVTPTNYLLQHTVTNLQPGTSYDISIIAENYLGDRSDPTPIQTIATTGNPNNGGGGSNGYWTQVGSDLHYISGNVGIGTADLDGWRLAVNGKIRAKEVKVEPNWADYVFSKDYNLPTVREVEKHIEKKGHLINIPSAIEVEANGIELGEMNKLLLEKIEELTLYIIDQEKRIIELEQKE